MHFLSGLQSLSSAQGGYKDTFLKEVEWKEEVLAWDDDNSRHTDNRSVSSILMRMTSMLQMVEGADAWHLLTLVTSMLASVGAGTVSAVLVSAGLRYCHFCPVLASLTTLHYLQHSNLQFAHHH